MTHDGEHHAGAQGESVAAVFTLLQERAPGWEPEYTTGFFAEILRTGGFNRATIKQAFGLAQIVESIGPITLRGAFYRAVSEGIFADTSDNYYRTAGAIVLKLRR